MTPNVRRLVNTLKTKKLPKSFLFSYAFFWAFMFLDIFTTLKTIKGDLSLEGNQLAVFWYEIMGPWASLEMIIWPVGVFLAAYIFDLKSRFLALWYLNWVAFSHLLGWLTWTVWAVYVFKLQNMLLNFSGIDFVYARPVSVIGIFLGLIFTLVQITICFSKKEAK